MTVLPAIDLRGGRCVRLLQGAFDRETVYDDDPVRVARRFEAAGARWLHVVDLDGARAGRPVQRDLVAAICAAVRVPVQVGGGLRDADGVAAILAAGAARAVLGTVAVEAPERCGEICRAFAGRVALGLDARAGRLRTAGWTAETGERPAVLAARAAELGAVAVVYTDIARDGTEGGPDVEGTREVARAAGLPVIASGGIGSLADVRAVAALAPDGVAGVIIGRALYTGRVGLADALAIADTA
jgi:phosphoribosylformimino-5-aminoimidazole carboxamide ribotide isomerase